jgi:hypothetical protein
MSRPPRARRGAMQAFCWRTIAWWLALNPFLDALVKLSLV